MLVFAPGTLVMGGDAPGWMHAAATRPLPEHDEKTEAVLLYSERSVNVVSADKIKIQVRAAYKILRPGGRDYGKVIVWMNPHRKVTGMRGWCIPAQGKDYSIKDKDAIELSAPKIEGGELVSDVKVKAIEIPAPDVGNVVGYEYEVEEQPLVLQDSWEFQHRIPVTESHYSLQLPSGWEYRAFFLNSPEVKPALASGNGAQWSVGNLKEIRVEERMPPLEGVAGQMIVSFFPSGGAVAKGFDSWAQMGTWYTGVTQGRRDISPEIQQKVTTLTASAATPLDKMKAIAQFIQSEIRYVAIELGSGGYLPHSAAEVFAHRYGDCKDKATLMSAMLHAAGIDSYYVIINAERGVVTPAMPAHIDGFNHMVLAIRLPEGSDDVSLVATDSDKHLGKLLYFDPTNELVPFGQIGGYLQANYGLLVAPTGGELIQLPQQPGALNGIQRSGKLTIDSGGSLRGEVHEVHVGDAARVERETLRSASSDSQKIHPIEKLLGASIPNYHITKAQVSNIQRTDQPFAYTYSFEAGNYAKTSGNLLLVRPRIVGTHSSALLETKEAREFPIEFRAPRRDTDVFEITVPAGFQVDEVPPPTDIDLSFASYHSKSEVVGDTLRYTRSFEIKELTVPVSQADELKKFYRMIAGDERKMAVLKAK